MVEDGSGIVFLLLLEVIDEDKDWDGEEKEIWLLDEKEVVMLVLSCRGD